MFGFDWNSDGEIDFFDDMLTLHVLDELEKDENIEDEDEEDTNDRN